MNERTSTQGHHYVRRTNCADNLLFADLLGYRSKRASQATLEIDRSVLHWVTLVGGDGMRVKDITSRFCAKMVRAMRKDGLSAGSIRTYLSNLITLLGFAKGVRMPDITSLMPPRQPSHKEALTPRDVSILHRTPCPHSSTAEAFFFAMHTALRFSDVASLRWADIADMADGLYVCKQMVKTGETVQIKLNATACAILHQKASQQHCNLNNVPKKKAVFHDLLSYNTVRNDLHDWGEQAHISVRNLTFHVARHTFASAIHAADIPLATISHLLGHRSLRTTETYIHSFAASERRAVEYLNNYGLSSNTAE